MKRLLLFPIWTICLSVTIGCSNENKSLQENDTIAIDSKDSVKAEAFTSDSALLDSVKIDSLRKDSLKNDSLKTDSITNVSQTDAIASGSTKADNKLKKDEANKCSAKTTWIISIISFILGVALTLGAICLINFLKNRKKKSKKTDLPVIQADVISEDDKNDEILRDLIVEK